MSTGKRQQNWIDDLIVADLGKLTDLPDAVAQRVRSVYSQLADAYLGWLRIQKNVRLIGCQKAQPLMKA